MWEKWRSSSMSVTVLLIAAAHGVPVFLAGAMSGNKAVVTVVALIMAAIAMATGNPAYAAADFVAILLTWLAMMGLLRG
jgi:hypothetical protein